jgi:hypothetical protein
MKKFVFPLWGLIGLIIFVPGCAKIGAPTGGPKDVTPPKYVDGVPENHSRNFTGKEISFRFDEFIVLDNISSELLISPPLSGRPEVRLRDKTVRVRLKDNLLPNTTYTLNFGNAIADLNEKNPLPDFEFVFSTGPVLDSLSVTGSAVNAFNHKPLKDQAITVMLYDNLADSAPYKDRPRYIGRTSKDGLFMVNNIRPDTFRVVAINDANSNMKYDPGTEEIAFLDSLLVLNAGNVKPVNFIRDTIKLSSKDKAVKQGNKKTPVKAAIDTTIRQGKKLNALNVNLYYFMEGTDQVFMNDKKRESPEKLFFAFSRPLHDSLLIRPLNYPTSGSWYQKETSAGGDTLVYWITDTTMAKKDTLRLSVSFTTIDSAGKFITRTDTLRMRNPQQAKPQGRRAKEVAAKAMPKKMNLVPGISNQAKQDLNKPVVFTTDRPIRKMVPEQVEFYVIRDSVPVAQKFTCARDPVNARRFLLTTEWEEGLNYKLLLKPGTVEDIYGLQNDSLNLKFVTQQMEYYGRLILTINGGKYPMIVQALDEKEKLVKAGILDKAGNITFDFLPPQTYTLKIIHDRNKNGHWDGGVYLKNIQPEEVYFYTLPVKLRSNWDQEVTWNISDK